MSDETSGIIGWPIVKQYRERANGWKERAMQSEQQLQSLRDLLIIAEGQRDKAKIDAEHWKGEWAVVMGQLGGASAEVEAVTKRAEAAEARRREIDDEAFAYAEQIEVLRRECEALRKDAAMLREAIDIFISFQGSTREPEGQAALDAALAVQPTTEASK